MRIHAVSIHPVGIPLENSPDPQLGNNPGPGGKARSLRLRVRNWHPPKCPARQRTVGGPRTVKRIFFHEF